jgi:hypothetical protein
MQKQKMRLMQCAIWVLMPEGNYNGFLAGNGVHSTAFRSNDDIQRPVFMPAHT